MLKTFLDCLCDPSNWASTTAYAVGGFILLIALGIMGFNTLADSKKKRSARPNPDLIVRKSCGQPFGSCTIGKQGTKDTH
ncbi:MAG: hypothetical protein JWL88_744 [Parcubacteria group bacterium]|nr:hypothetical protein [Parcubacteria group bacterium]